MKPIGRVESPLADPAQAPNQGGEGAPPAWPVIEPHLAEGIRDLRAGARIIVLTWLDRARRDELSTVPKTTTRVLIVRHPAYIPRALVAGVNGSAFRVADLSGPGIPSIPGRRLTARP